MKGHTMQNTAPEKMKHVSSDQRKNPMQRLLEIFCAVLIGGVVVLLFAQVAVRHLGGGSLPWSGEMATWLFSWSTFIGAVLVYMEKKHIVIDFLVAYLPPRYLRVIGCFQQVTIIAVLITLLITGVQITLLYANQTATSIDISKALLFVSLPISSALMIGWTVYGWIKGRLKKC